jgi:hypothetical protein
MPGQQVITAGGIASAIISSFSSFKIVKKFTRNNFSFPQQGGHKRGWRSRSFGKAVLRPLKAVAKPIS